MSRLRGRRLWYSVAEWAELTGEKPNTTRRKLREGRLRGRRTTSGWRVLASELTKRGGR